MKLILLVLAVALVVLSEGKPLENIERKCIVKYLSDRELLDSSFEVEAVNPEICDDLVKTKKDEIMEEIFTYSSENERVIFLSDIYGKFGLADVVLKSLLYGNSTEAEDLKRSLQAFEDIVIFDCDHNEMLSLIFKTIKSMYQDDKAAIKMCMYKESFLFATLNKTVIKFDCDELTSRSSIRSELENMIIATLATKITEKDQKCMKKAYKDSSINKPFTAEILNLIVNSDLFDLSYTRSLSEFYKLSQQCLRLGFRMKDVPQIRNVYSLEYRNEDDSYYLDFELLVKFNPDRSHNETLIIADNNKNTSLISECFSERLELYGFSKYVLKTMSIEADFDVVRLTKMQNLLHHLIKQSISDCETTFFDQLFNKTINFHGPQMICISEFDTHKKVEGLTSYGFNMFEKPIKCLGFLIDARKHGLFIAPSFFCSINKTEMSKILKRMWAIEKMAGYEVSEQQGKEMTQEYNELIEESKKLLAKCFAGMSDDI